MYLVLQSYWLSSKNSSSHWYIHLWMSWDGCQYPVVSISAHYNITVSVSACPGSRGWSRNIRPVRLLTRCATLYRAPGRRRSARSLGSNGVSLIKSDDHKICGSGWGITSYILCVYPLKPDPVWLGVNSKDLVPPLCPMLAPPCYLNTPVPILAPLPIGHPPPINCPPWYQCCKPVTVTHTLSRELSRNIK